MHESLEALVARKCVCGAVKEKGKAFCYGCFKRLIPRRLQIRLYSRAGDGFEQAYDEAKKIILSGTWKQ